MSSDTLGWDSPFNILKPEVLISRSMVFRELVIPLNCGQTLRSVLLSYLQHVLGLEKIVKNQGLNWKRRLSRGRERCSFSPVGNVIQFLPPKPTRLYSGSLPTGGCHFPAIPCCSSHNDKWQFASCSGKLTASPPARLMF